jgi:hypothetical protein
VILVALILGVILIVAAIRNSQGALFAALGVDVPGFVVWAAAIFAVGVVGYVPGLKTVSRGLLALVIVALVLNNYQKILAGFQSAWQHPTPVAPPPGTSASGVGGSPASGALDAALGNPNSINLNNLAPVEAMTLNLTGFGASLGGSNG